MILRTTYNVEGAEDLRFYYNQNWRADVSVVLDDSGIQQERVSYSPYGQAFGHAAGDTDFDGDHDSTDSTAISGWNGNDPFVDVDLDGDVDNADDTAADADSLGWDVLSSDDVNSRYGNVGYTQDRDISQFYHGRGYVYSNLLGRMVHLPGRSDVGGEGCSDPCGCSSTRDSPSGCGSIFQPFDCTGQIDACEFEAERPDGSFDLRRCYACCLKTPCVADCQENCDRAEAAYPKADCHGAECRVHLLPVKHSALGVEGTFELRGKCDGIDKELEEQRWLLKVGNWRGLGERCSQRGKVQSKPCAKAAFGGAGDSGSACLCLVPRSEWRWVFDERVRFKDVCIDITQECKGCGEVDVGCAHLIGHGTCIDY
ncbi:MAG: hypothetical protein ACF8NJ_03560 [Phycisphaerales bacterium JB038]